MSSPSMSMGLGTLIKDVQYLTILRPLNLILFYCRKHTALRRMKECGDEWGSQIVFSHGTRSARGVAVLFDKKLPKTMETYRFDQEGRILVLDMVIGEKKFILANLYGPNEDKPEFYVKAFDLIEKRENNSIIIGGDLNTTMHPDKDLYNNKGLNHVKKREVLTEYLELKGLVDVWRDKHPDDTTFTWKKQFSKELVMSRLDYFFVSQDFLLKTNAAEIKSRYISDHSRVILNLDFTDAPRGKGYWKFNNTHLRDKEFVDVMNDTIMSYLYSVKNKNESSPDIQWENLKKVMIKKSKDFSIQKAKEKNTLIEKLENRILILDKRLIAATQGPVQDKIKKQIKDTEIFLLDQHEQKVNAAKFRSKAQYYLYGEKKLIIFF